MTNPDSTIPVGDGLGSVGGAGMLLPGIGGIIDTMVSAQTSRRNTDKTIAAQRAEAEKAYQRQIAMWHMQNAYNSPEEQMKRFGAAGLNPHLIYGQGSSGNANSYPQYQPPNIQYKYAAPAYGAAVGSILPTMMAVGTWMQNMRQSEVDIQSKQTNIEKAEQLIDFLNHRYPHLIREIDQKESLWPYQGSIQQDASRQASIKTNEALQEYAQRWTGPAPENMRGTKGLEYMQKLAEMKLKRAQASWTDFNVTNPQGLMQLVLGSVMGLAGQQLRLSTHRSLAKTPQKKIGRTIETIDKRTGRKVKRWIYE